MEQRDLIKDQIEQLGRVLGKILADFLNLKSKGEVTFGIETTQQQLKSELDIDINKLIGLNKNELKTYIEERQFIDAHLEYLSEVVFEFGKNNSEKSAAYFQKSIELLQIADKVSNTLSYDRMNRIKIIEGLTKE